MLLIQDCQFLKDAECGNSHGNDTVGRRRQNKEFIQILNIRFPSKLTDGSTTEKTIERNKLH